MKHIDRFTKGEVKINYIETINPQKTLTPLMYIPGALGEAKQFIDVIEELSPRHSISLSLRGRGASDAPKKGYSFENHVIDINSVINQSKITDFCLMAHSLGVPYAIGYATKNIDKIKALILCDYPAKYPQISESWIESAEKLLVKERAHVVKEIQTESIEKILWKELSKISCPVLVIKGGTDGSLLNKDDELNYRNFLKNVDVIEFKESGHEPWIPNYNEFIDTVKNFLEKVDNL